MRISKTATAVRMLLCAPQESEGGESFSAPAQDIETRVENILYPQDEPESVDEDGAESDGEDLPDTDDPEAEVEDGEEDEPESEEDEDDSLAALLGIDEDKLDVDEDGNVTVAAVIDGKTENVDLKELVKSYQLQGHVNNKSVKLSEDRKTFDDEVKTHRDTINQRLDGAESLMQYMEQSLLADYNSIDWNMLRQTDPSEWSALRQEFTDKARQIDQAKGLASQERERLQGEVQAEEEKKQKEYLDEEFAKMVENNPTWQDQSVMQTEVQEIGNFLMSQYGFTNEELAAVVDHRLVKLIQDAQSHVNGKTNVEQKKVKKAVPKFKKPGTVRKNSASTEKARRVKALRAKVRDGGGRTEDVAALIYDRM